MQILITGGTGFVGRHLLTKLSATHTLICPVRSIEAKKSNVIQQKDNANIQYVSIEDTASLEHMFRTRRIDGMINLMASSEKGMTADNLNALVEANFTRPSMLLNLGILNGLDWCVTIGSHWEAKQSRLFSSDVIYTSLKKSFSSYAESLCVASGISFLKLNLSDVYGLNDHRKKIVNMLIDKLNQTNTTMPTTSGLQYINLCHVDDVVAGIEMSVDLLQKTKKSITAEFDLYGDACIKIKDLAGLIERNAGVKIDFEWGALTHSCYDVFVPYYGLSKFPGWQPKVNLEKGLRELISRKFSG